MKEIVFIEINETFKSAVTMAKQMGYTTKLLTGILDINLNYYDSSYFKDFDEIIRVNTHSIDDMLKAINQHNTVAILACYDDHVLNAALLAQKLSLPHANIDGLRVAQCKDFVRKHLHESGYIQPKFYILHEELLSNTIYNQPPLPFPLIFKPVHEAGSQGVKLCHTIEDYQKAVQLALQCTKTYSGYVMERRWLLEEYIPGNIYGAQMLWTDNQWKLLGITKEVINSQKTMALQGIVFPSHFSSTLLADLENEFSQWANCIGLKMGALDIEFKFVNDKPVLIEINPRLAGARIAKLMELSLNKSIVEYLLKSYLGEIRSFGSIQPIPDRHFAQMFLYPSKNGTVQEFSNMISSNEDSSLIENHFRSAPFDIEIKDSIDDVIGYSINQGVSEQDAIDNALKSLSKIKIDYKVETNDNFTVSAGLLTKFSTIQQEKNTFLKEEPLLVLERAQAL